MSLASSRSTRGSSKLQFGVLSSVSLGIARLRSSSTKKLPEPLRRAITDCLSDAHYGGALASSIASYEASRILRDYLAASSTTDLTYGLLIEHTIAERERRVKDGIEANPSELANLCNTFFSFLLILEFSTFPAVVARCVALLKRYLLRYKPGVETLEHIDRFCVIIIAECDPNTNCRMAQLSVSPIQTVGSTTSTSTSTRLPVSSIASSTLIKSLYYVRSLLAQHIPKRSSQPATFVGTASVSKHALPALSSMLKKSFNSQLNHATAAESSERKDDANLLISSKSIKKVDLVVEDQEYMANDVLQWRWLREHQESHASSESDDHVVHPQDLIAHNFLEVGAAALLVGDMEAKIKGQPWEYLGNTDMPYLDQLWQPSNSTPSDSSVSGNSHVRAITASKRSKGGPRQIWEESPVNTFHPRVRPLFQYRHYSEQQPLRLNPAEVCEVITAVCSEVSTLNTPTTMTVSSKLPNNATPSTDAAVSVLIKLIIDMYVMDQGMAAPLSFSVLQEMLYSTRPECRIRAFDVILNLGVHAQLLEPMLSDVSSTIEEEYCQGQYVDCETQLAMDEEVKSPLKATRSSTAIKDFETWILNILHEILLFLVQIEEMEESVWASALSCLLFFVSSRGKILTQKLQGLDIRVIRSLLETSRRNSWADIVHCKLISMLTNLLYKIPTEPADCSSTPTFLIDKVDLIGGIEFIFLEYSLASSREERRNLYLVLFDYVLHQINGTYRTSGVSEFRDDEIRPLATLLTLVDAPEAFFISLKLGVQGLGEILRRSISDALAIYPNSERLNMLLEHVTERFDTLVSSFTHLDKEFSHMVAITKSFKFPRSIEDPFIGNAVNLYWSTLHSLLHSEGVGCRQNGYIWLSDLLISEISDEKSSSSSSSANIWSNIEVLQQRITQAGVMDCAVGSNVPFPIWLFCGLLKSKNSVIRWGFLFVLDRLLMRCKFLLDERRLQSFSSITSIPDGDMKLNKANAVIDIMSSALLLVCQLNETDRINILKMCDIVFSQVCLKVLPSNHGDGMAGPTENKNMDAAEPTTKQQPENSCSRPNENTHSGSASMAALLLQGCAVVPMQLISRIPAALLYWPLIQLASAATDNIALGVAVGSSGKGNLPGAASDIRATLLLLLIGKCTVDASAFMEVGGEEFFRELLDDTDSRVAYYSSAFLLKRMMTEKPDKYQHMLQNLVFKAQQSNNEKLLENPYLQMRGILQLANDLGIEL